jgi:hypothetical protein
MGLEDFEKELAQGKAKESHKKRNRSRSRDRHGHHHRSKTSHRDHDNREDRHSHKRSRHNRETSEERARRKRQERERGEDNDGHPRRKHSDRRSRSPSSDDEDRISRKRKSRHHEEDDDDDDDDDDDEMPDRADAPPGDEILDQQLAQAEDANLQRDSWMETPSSLQVDYVQPRKKEDKSAYVPASMDMEARHKLKIHQAELNHHLADVKCSDADQGTEEPAQREVDYTFGDSGSQWRMTKLKGVYRTAEETGRSVEDVALEKYGDLRDFDDAREEEIEVDRRKMYGKNYIGKETPSGELYEERRLQAGIHRPPRLHTEDPELPQGEAVEDPQPIANTTQLSLTELNKLKAQMMKAKMKGAANAAQLETDYNAAAAGFVNRKNPDVVVLNAMDNRQLAGGRKGEVVAIDNKRGKERGLVKENEDMSVEDMVRQEKRTRGQPGGEGRLLADQIAKDGKFDVSRTSPCP